MERNMKFVVPNTGRQMELSHPVRSDILIFCDSPAFLLACLLDRKIGSLTGIHLPSRFSVSLNVMGGDTASAVLI